MIAVEIPKEFAIICELIRDGKNEGIEKLNVYENLERQKKAVLAEIAYFNGDFDYGISAGVELCPFWHERHYSNIRQEHTAAMAFSAKLVKREDEIISLFKEQIAICDSNSKMPAHIKSCFAHGKATPLVCCLLHTSKTNGIFHTPCYLPLFKRPQQTKRNSFSNS